MHITLQIIDTLTLYGQRLWWSRGASNILVQSTWFELWARDRDMTIEWIMEGCKICKSALYPSSIKLWNGFEPVDLRISDFSKCTASPTDGAWILQTIIVMRIRGSCESSMPSTPQEYNMPYNKFYSLNPDVLWLCPSAYMIMHQVILSEF